MIWSALAGRLLSARYDHLAVTDVALTQEEVKRRDRISALRSEDLGWMIERQDGGRSLAAPVHGRDS
jgi:hypothetical protein